MFKVTVTTEAALAPGMCDVCHRHETVAYPLELSTLPVSNRMHRIYGDMDRLKDPCFQGYLDNCILMDMFTDIIKQFIFYFNLLVVKYM